MSLGQPPPQATPAPAPRVAPDPDNPPWGVLEAVGLLVVSFVLMLVTTAAVLIPYIFYRHVRLDALAEFVIKDPGAIFVQIVSIIPAHLLTLGLAWLIVTRAGKRPFWRSLGWDWGAAFRQSTGLTVAAYAVLAVALYLVGLCVIWLTGPTDNALERLIQSSRGAALATAFAASLTAPLIEEIVFRGVLYSALRRLAGTRWAVATVLLIFAAIHVPQYWPSYGVIGTILLLSIVLTLIRARTGRLLPCFFVHFVFNTIQAIIIILNPYLERLAPEKAAPAPGLLLELLARLYGG